MRMKKKRKKHFLFTIKMDKLIKSSENCYKKDRI